MYDELRRPGSDENRDEGKDDDKKDIPGRLNIGKSLFDPFSWWSAFCLFFWGVLATGAHLLYPDYDPTDTICTLRMGLASLVVAILRIIMLAQQAHHRRRLQRRNDASSAEDQTEQEVDETEIPGQTESKPEEQRNQYKSKNRRRRRKSHSRR